MRVSHFIWKSSLRVWKKSGEAQEESCSKSNGKFPPSVMIRGDMSSVSVGPLCFHKSRVNAVIYQEISQHFMLVFQQDLAPVPKLLVTGLLTAVLLRLIGQLNPIQKDTV